jgi:hypothetical protein
MPLHSRAPSRTAAFLLALGVGCVLPGEDTLRSGETLRPGRELVSPNRFHYLGFDHWGRPLLWVKGHGQFKYLEVPLWVAPVSPDLPGPARLTLEADNNLVLYGPDRAVRWSTGTAGQGEEPAQLTVTDEGELCLTSGTACLWKSRPNICWDRRRAPGRDAGGQDQGGRKAWWRRGLRSLLGLLAVILADTL